MMAGRFDPCSHLFSWKLGLLTSSAIGGPGANVKASPVDERSEVSEVTRVVNVLTQGISPEPERAQWYLLGHEHSEQATVQVNRWNYSRQRKTQSVRVNWPPDVQIGLYRVW